MYKVSDAYKTAMKKPVQQFSLSGAIGTTTSGTDTNGIAFTDKNILKGSFSITNQCSDESAIRIGQVYIGELNATFINIDIPRYAWKGAVITASCGLKIADGTFEEVPLGFFTIDEAKWTRSGIVVKAYDNMTKIAELTKAQLTAQNFIDHGALEKAPWSVIKSHLSHPCILKWKEGSIDQNIYATISGVPVPQIIQAVADLSSATIKGIKAMTSVYEGNVSVSYSYDNSSWTDFSDMATFLQTDLAALYNGLMAEKKIHFKIRLSDVHAAFTNLVMQYQN